MWVEVDMERVIKPISRPIILKPIRSIMVCSVTKRDPCFIFIPLFLGIRVAANGFWVTPFLLRQIWWIYGGGFVSGTPDACLAFLVIVGCMLTQVIMGTKQEVSDEMGGVAQVLRTPSLDVRRLAAHYCA